MKSEQQDYLFEQFSVERGCLGYVVADPETRLAAIVDPEAEMVEPMLGFVFEHSLRLAYVIDTHTHADHVSGARNLKTKSVAKLVMHEKAPSSAVDVRVQDGDRLHLGAFPLKLLHTPGHANGHMSVLLRLPKTGAVILAIDAIYSRANRDASRANTAPRSRMPLSRPSGFTS